MRSIPYFPEFLKNAFLCLTLLTPHTSLAYSKVCTLSAQQEAYFLSLSFDAFDQSENGWRLLSDETCYMAASQLIIHYVAAHPKLVQWQKANLYFHAGQLYAFDERNVAAVQMMHKAHHVAPTPEARYWNAYVDATIAFLNKNKFALKRNRDIMSSLAFGKPDINLMIVDNMLTHFYKPYSQVYVY